MLWLAAGHFFLFLWPPMRQRCSWRTMSARLEPAGLQSLKWTGAPRCGGTQTKQGENREDGTAAHLVHGHGGSSRGMLGPPTGTAAVSLCTAVGTSVSPEVMSAASLFGRQRLFGLRRQPSWPLPLPCGHSACALGKGIGAGEAIGLPEGGAAPFPDVGLYIGAPVHSTRLVAAVGSWLHSRLVYQRWAGGRPWFGVAWQAQRGCSQERHLVQDCTPCERLDPHAWPLSQ